MKDFPPDILEALDKIEKFPVDYLLLLVGLMNDILLEQYEGADPEQVRESRDRTRATTRRILDKIAEKMGL
jgi:hypothetical protein